MVVFEGSRGAHVEGEEMKQNEMFARTKEEVKESARTDRLKKRRGGDGGEGGVQVSGELSAS